MRKKQNQRQKRRKQKCLPKGTRLLPFTNTQVSQASPDANQGCSRVANQPSNVDPSIAIIERVFKDPIEDDVIGGDRAKGSADLLVIIMPLGNHRTFQYIVGRETPAESVLWGRTRLGTSITFFCLFSLLTHQYKNFQ